LAPPTSSRNARPGRGDGGGGRRGLGRRGAGRRAFPQPADDVEPSEVVLRQFLGVGDSRPGLQRHPEIPVRVRRELAERRREHADNGRRHAAGAATEIDRPPDGAGVAAKAALPVGVAEHDGRRGVEPGVVAR
jgi:hypothetical protein